MTDPTSITDPRINTVLQGRYRVLARIAAGGMGVVYRGERVELGRAVAIKFLHPWIASDAEFKRRFENEAKAMSRLAHPCCTSVIDFGEDQGAPFLVMDFVVGDTLRTLLREGPLSTTRAVTIARQILAGLSHAHEQGITHRDIKPDNVVVSQAHGFGEQVRILDFGVAKLRDVATGATLGMVVGTPAYMAPEQARGEEVDERTDLYSVGILLFELITGSKPFEGEQNSDIFRLQQEAVAPPLRSRRPDVTFSEELEALLAKALQKKPDRRFQTASEFSSALERLPEMGGSDVTSTARRRTQREISGSGEHGFARRSRVWLALGLGTAAAALLGTAFFFQRRESPPPATERASAPSAGNRPEAPAEDLPELKEARKLAASGRRESALAAFARLRTRYPERGDIAYFEGEVNFQNFRWDNGLKSFQAAVEKDPSYRSHPDLIRHLIRCLDSDRFHLHCENFLSREVGKHALPQLSESAGTDPLKNIRSRAARLADRIRRSGDKKET